MKILDLGYGNPGFLQDQWSSHNFLKEINDFQSMMAYKYGKKPDKPLTEKIKKLHQLQNNFNVNKDTQIAITVGAGQALVASMSYFKSKGYDSIYIPKPFWSRFKIFADALNLPIVEKANSKSIKLITSPNNPDGKDQSSLAVDIQDSCYNWSHYSENVKKMSESISIFSLSKLTGHSSTRIGWVASNNSEIFEYITNYVNTFTAGVSIESQLQASKIIDVLLDTNFFEKTNDVLKRRIHRLNLIVEEHNLPIKILSQNGMFWYIETNESLIKELNIICAKGEDFFDPISNRYRLNIGIDYNDFESFCERLSSIKI